MATVGKVRGKLVNFFYSDDAGTTFDKVAHSDSFNFTSGFAMDNVTDNCNTNLFMDKLPNDIEWGFSGEAYWLFDSEVGKKQGHAVLADHITQLAVIAKFTTDVTGDFEQEGSGYLNNITITASTADYFKFSYEFTGTGVYTNVANPA